MLQEAATRKMEYMLGLFADPIYFGDYPASVKERVSVLQEITPELVCVPARCCTSHSVRQYHQRSPGYECVAQAQALNGSCDYFGLNHYTTT